MTEQQPEQPQQTTNIVGAINRLLNRIPARRWYIIALRCELTEDTILGSPSLSAAIAANEHHRSLTGTDDYGRFLDMGLEDLYDYIDAGETEQQPAAPAGDQAEAEEVPSRFPGQPSSVGMADEPSPILPGHQDFTD